MTPQTSSQQTFPAVIIEQLEAVGLDHYSHERFERALTTFELLLQRGDKPCFYWTIIGVIHRRRKQRGLAIKALTQAVESDKRDRQAQVLLGETLCEVGRPEEGVRLLRNVFELGHQPNLEPEHQDHWTKRSGAVLEAVQMTLRAWMDTQRASAV